jgi:hypothetical protein
MFMNVSSEVGLFGSMVILPDRIGVRHASARREIIVSIYHAVNVILGMVAPFSATALLFELWELPIIHWRVIPRRDRGIQLFDFTGFPLWRE